MEWGDVCVVVYQHNIYKQLTVTCPLGVSGGSHVMTIVDELNGRTWTFLGALSISVNIVLC